MSRQLRILIVEDSEDDAFLMLRELVRGGFEPLHERVETAESFRAALAEGRWDVVIADYRMPRFNALAALDIVRKSGLDLPFIIISGKIGEDLAVSAMKAGAHDYLMKSNMSRLVPAIERELRDARERRGRREAEQVAFRAKSEWKAAFDAVSDLIVLTDPDGRIIRCNRKVIEEFATTFQELLGKNLAEVFYGDQFPEAAVFRCPVAEGAEEEIRFPNLAGWFNVACYPMQTAEEGAHAFVYVIKDVTKRKQAEDALQSQFRQISTIFDSLNALVYVADMENQELLFMNKFGAMLTGSDWKGKKCHEVLQHGQIDPCSFCTTDKLVLDGKTRPPYVWEFHNPLTGRWYQCIDKAVSWTDGRLVRLEIAIDISERKEIEQMKDEMISAVSHEMRSPLTAILGFTEFLLENEVEAPQMESSLNTIRKEAVRLKELIGNFLDLQQISARATSYRFRPVDVCLLVNDAAGLFAINHDEHRIAIDCPDGLPLIDGDEARLHQVLTNIISNALKYSPKETVVSIGARSEADSVTIWVRDGGIGIPAELHERIFEKFYRVDNTDRRLIGGTGLGLALVREIVTAHGGRAWVESAVGKGSTFFVTLPIAQKAG